MAKSKIRDALVELTGLKEIRGEEDVAFRKRLISAVGELSDGDWESLSSEQQDWFNDAADNINAKKDPIDFPDLEEEAATTRTRRGAAPAEEPEPTTRRGRKDAAPAVESPVVGDIVIVTNNRDKVYEGELVEIDGDIIVVVVNGAEVEFTKDRCKSVVKKESESGCPATSDLPEYVPALKDIVTIINTRDKETTGEIVELDDEVIIIDSDGKDVEFKRDRIKSIVLAAEPEPEPAKANGRRSGAEVDTSRRGAPAKEVPAPATDKKKISAKDNGGVSVSQRIMELVAEDIKATKDEIAKILTKEGLEFRDNTLAMNHASAHKFITILKAAGHTIK